MAHNEPVTWFAAHPFEPTRAERYRSYTPETKGSNSLPADTVFYIWEDDQGLLWLATRQVRPRLATVAAAAAQQQLKQARPGGIGRFSRERDNLPNRLT